MVMGSGAAISIVCKTPGIGGGKSRLRPLLGADLTARLSACFIRDVAATLEALPDTLGRSLHALFMPEGSEAILRRLLPPDWTLTLRHGACVGEILNTSTTAFLADGHDCAIAMNADSPTLPTAFVAQAIAALRAPGDRVVLGPALDGGYYLIGLKRPHPRLFQDIVWSTPEVLARTLDRAAEINLPVTLLPMWYDVDDAQDLELLQAELAGNAPRFVVGGPARHTRALLAAQAGGPQVSPWPALPLGRCNLGIGRVE